MWDKLKALAQHPAAQALKKFCGDPVQLYSVFLIMTAMYYYHRDWSWLYTIIALVLSFVLMRFYDFVARKRLIGPLCYLAFMGLGLYVTGMITNLGQQSYPITFMVWFLTPQGVVEFSMLYTIAIFMLMVGFITSAVYYFAKVRYRMVMQFLIMLIPLSLYAKEELQMPAHLVILLLASYFLLMVYCRQLRANDEVRHLSGLSAGASIAIYVAAFSVLAAIIPKPQFEADREFIDNAMSYTSWSDILMNAISMFTDSTDNTLGTSNNARTIFYVDSPEDLRLRTQTFSYYLGNDSWNVIYEYDRPERHYEAPLNYQPRALTQAILDAAAADADFAAEYDLKDAAGTVLPAQELRQVTFYPLWNNMAGVPTPTRTEHIINVRPLETYMSHTKTVAMYMRDLFPEVRYYSDTYIRMQAVADVLRRLHQENYDALLEDAAGVLAGVDPEAMQIVEKARLEYQEALTEFEIVHARDYQSEVIDSLAAELTAGLDNDLDKALAIEQYFTANDYIYDQSFRKEKGDNIDTFLTESHTGVCYEYATAMTLLCRSAGIPTRFVEGYNMGERYNGTFSGNGTTNRTNYLIKMRDAHAFPEVYIAGYGWVSFEPTVAPLDEGDSTAENAIVMRWGFVLLVLCLIALGIWFILPHIREKQFCRKLLTLTPVQAASAIFIRMRHTLHLPDSATVHALEHSSCPFFADERFFDEMDALLYNTTEHPTMTASQLAETYIKWQANRKAYEKEQKKLRKEQKKSNVNV